jgi:hypothetical protein
MVPQIDVLVPIATNLRAQKKLDQLRREMVLGTIPSGTGTIPSTGFLRIGPER